MLNQNINSIRVDSLIQTKMQTRIAPVPQSRTQQPQQYTNPYGHAHSTSFPQNSTVWTSNSSLRQNPVRASNQHETMRVYTEPVFVQKDIHLTNEEISKMKRQLEMLQRNTQKLEKGNIFIQSSVFQKTDNPQHSFKERAQTERNIQYYRNSEPNIQNVHHNGYEKTNYFTKNNPEFQTSVVTEEKNRGLKSIDNRSSKELLNINKLRSDFNSSLYSIKNRANKQVFLNNPESSFDKKQSTLSSNSSEIKFKTEIINLLPEDKIEENIQEKLLKINQRISQLEKDNQSLRSNLKAKTQQRDELKSTLSDQRNQIKTTNNDEIKVLEQQIQQLERQSTQKKQKLNQQQSKIALLTQNDQMPQNLKQQLIKKENKLLQLEDQINKLQQQQLSEPNLSSQNKNYVLLQKKLYEKDEQISQYINQLIDADNNIKALKETYIEMKTQIDELKTFQMQMQKKKYEKFDEVLVSQVETINNLKQKMQSLHEKINDCKYNLIELQCVQKSYNNEIAIAQLRHNSSLQNIRIESEIKVAAQKKQIQSLNIKIKQTDLKYKSIISLIKAMDQFFACNVIKRADSSIDASQYIQQILRKYQIAFMSEQTKDTVKV